MLKRGCLLLIAILALAGCDDSPTEPSDPNVVIFNAQLSAANEVPPVTNAEANARGDARVIFNLTRDSSNAITGATVDFFVNLSNFPNGSTWTLAHIHRGAASVAGGVVINTGLTPANAITLTGGSVTNQAFTAISVTNAELINEILDNPAGFYFNAHTVLNGGGAVRGQLVRQQ
jgi:hypothetical protein